MFDTILHRFGTPKPTPNQPKINKKSVSVADQRCKCFCSGLNLHLKLVFASTSEPANLDFDETLTGFVRFLRFQEDHIKNHFTTIFDALEAPKITLKSKKKWHRCKKTLNSLGLFEFLRSIRSIKLINNLRSIHSTGPRARPTKSGAARQPTCRGPTGPRARGPTSSAYEIGRWWTTDLF